MSEERVVAYVHASREPLSLTTSRETGVYGPPAAVVRMMILDRNWAADWDYAPGLLGPAVVRLEDLYRAAGRTSAESAAMPEVRRLLVTGLSVPAAIDVAIEAGGACARTVAATLGLS